MWKDIKNAPKIIGHPLWVRGYNFGNPERGEHYVWAYWNGEVWREAGFNSSVLLYLTEYLDEK